MSESTSEQRTNWRAYKCEEHKMVKVPFGPDEILVAPPTVDAWKALAAVVKAHGYEIRVDETDSYNCRPITGGTGNSLHSYGIALDINDGTNPFKYTPDLRRIRFSDKQTQKQRADDVKRSRADTDMTPGMVEDALAIRTNNGKRVFEWGGNWTDRKDAMHFEIDVTPEDLAAGIDWSSVRGSPPQELGDGGEGFDDLDAEPNVPDEIGTLSFGARGVQVKVLQQKLTDLGYQLGAIDGEFGTLTREALLSFQSNNNLETTGVTDAATRSALEDAGRRPLWHDRIAATAALLRRLGSTTVKAADNTKIVAFISSILGALGISSTALVQFANSVAPGVGAAPDYARTLNRQNIQILDSIEKLITDHKLPLGDKGPEVKTFFDQVHAMQSAKPAMQTIFDLLPNSFAHGTDVQSLADILSGAATSIIPGFGGSLAALGIGLAANYFANNVIKRRVEDYASGANINR